MASLIALAKLGFPENLAGAEQWAAQVGESRDKGYVVSSRMLVQLTKPLEREAIIAARLRAALAALAVERYRQTTSSALPDSLGQLGAQGLATVPPDPFDGKPMRYRKTAPKGYVVYSIGPDRRDGGGQPPVAGPAPNRGDGDLTFMVRR